MLSKYFKQADATQSVKRHSQPSLASPASHLETHINHLLFETDMNQRKHTSDSQRASADIKTERKSGSGTLLNIQQLDLTKRIAPGFSDTVKVTCHFPVIVTAKMAADQFSGH